MPARDETELLEALEENRRELGDNHPDTIASLNKLAGLYYMEGRGEEAEPLCREALEKNREALGSDDPNTLVSLRWLALLYEKLERYQEAEPLLLEALQRNRTVFGNVHLDTLTSLADLASFLHHQGRNEEAAEYSGQLFDAPESEMLTGWIDLDYHIQSALETKPSPPRKHDLGSPEGKVAADIEWFWDNARGAEFHGGEGTFCQCSTEGVIRQSDDPARMRALFAAGFQLREASRGRAATQDGVLALPYLICHPTGDGMRGGAQWVLGGHPVGTHPPMPTPQLRRFGQYLTGFCASYLESLSSDLQLRRAAVAGLRPLVRLLERHNYGDCGLKDLLAVHSDEEESAPSA